MKRFISRRSFLKTAGVTTAAAAVAVGAPSASACFGKGKLPEITILYTNDVHTYIDHKSPELTYASIAALKKSYEEQGKNVLLVGCWRPYPGHGIRLHGRWRHHHPADE